MSTKPTVLIVDDDGNLRKTLTDILRFKGYTATNVYTGQAGLEAAQTQMPTVALIDLKLENMSGLEVMGQIQRMSPRTECIVLTGHASQASAIERREAQEHSQRLLEQQLIVNRLALALGETHDLQCVFYTLYKHARDLMDAQAFIVSFYENQARLFRAGYIVNDGQVLDVTAFPPIPLEEPGRGNQSRGHVIVHSQPGQGATFRIYWPRAEAQAKDDAEDRVELEVKPAPLTSTILVVEDSADVRDLTVSILREEGHQVLAAGDGGEALRLARDHEGPIHLLLTDVVMPQMSGKELADQIKRQRPETKILYASGYTDDRIAHHGVLDPGVALLRKPFTLESLIDKVQVVLEAGT